MSLAFSPAPSAGLPHPACSLSDRADELPLQQLSASGLHEIKSDALRDAPAALGFTLAVLGEWLGRRRGPPSPFLLCQTGRVAREWGAPYGPGLRAFGLDPALFLIVQTRNDLDAAWAVEEALKSRAFGWVLVQAEIKDPHIARRLGLAALTARTPCLLLSGHRGGGLPATQTRWRLRAVRSGAAPFDVSAPGPPAWRLTLERCRGLAGERSLIVEFHRDAYGVRLAPRFADRTAEAGDDRQAFSG